MGLKEQIKKDEEELKKLQAAEDDDSDDNDDEEDDADDSDDQDDDTDEDEGADDKAKGKKAAADDKKGKKADEDDDSDEDDDDAGDDPKKKNDLAAKLRKERKERMKLQEQLAAFQAKPPVQAQQPPVQQQPGTKKTETTEEKVARLESEQNAQRQARERQDLERQAIDEFNEIETEFKKETPDYDQASAHVIQSMYNGAKAAYPDLTDKQALGFVQRRVLQIASAAAKRGLNPAEVLYQMAFDNYGYQPGAPKKKDTQKADNLKNIAKNRKRSASSMAGAGQNAGARATIDEANKMDLATFGNMSEAEIDELIAQAD